MYLKPVLVVIRHPGESVKQFAGRLGISGEYASKTAALLEREGLIKKVRSGRTVLLVPDPDSPVTILLKRLDSAGGGEEQETVEKLVEPAGNLRLIAALRSGPKTMQQVMSLLECSRPTFFRMLAPYGPKEAGVVIAEGTREKTYGLDVEHSFYEPLGELASLLHGVEEPVVLEPGEEKNIKLTSLRARVILHASSYLNYRDRPVSTPALTQEGIAQGLWTTQQIISKELKRLVGLGLLSVTRKHIKDKKRRFKTYDLTNAGMDENELVLQTLDSLSIPYKDLSGKRGQDNIHTILGLLKSKVSTVEVLNYMAKNKVVDCSDLQKSVESRRVSEFISNYQRLAGLQYFFGRAKETERFREWLENDKAGMLAVKGIAGIGKTTFLARIIQEHRRQWNLFFYTVNEWSTLDNVLNPLGGFLGKMGRDHLKDVGASDDDIDIEMTIQRLREALKDSRALLIFDDVHKSDERIGLFFKALVRSAFQPGVKIVLSGREMPSFYDRRDVFVTGTVQEMELTGLDQPTSEKLLAERGIDESEFDTLYGMTKGHPLALELIDKMDGFSNRNLNLFIMEEIIPKLTNVEINIMRYTCVFRHPFNKDAYSIIQDSLRTGGEEGERKQVLDIVEGLVGRSYIIRSRGRYRIGDIFRDFFYSSMDKRTRDEIHLTAARFYNGFDTDDARLEVFFHLASGGRGSDALDYLAKTGDVLLDKGMSHDIGEVVSKIRMKGLSRTAGVHYHYYLGVFNFNTGDWKKALARFEKSWKLASKRGYKGLGARALGASGRLKALAGDGGGGRKELLRAFDRAAALGLNVLASDICLALGELSYDLKNIKDLRRFSKKARRLRKEAKDKRLVMNSRLLSSLVFLAAGEKEKALKTAKLAKRSAESSGNSNRRIRAVLIIGTALMHQGKWDEGLKIFEDIIRSSREAGEAHPRARGLLNSAVCLIELGRNDEAESRLYEALHYFTQFGDARNLLSARKQLEKLGTDIAA